MNRWLALGLACALGTASAAERVIATLTDPTGDDNGSGTLVYPQRSDMQPGDLDLVALKIVRIDDAYRFEATFRNPIRHPATVSGDSGLESIANFARRGFYAFNLDVYLDQDRIQGSGNTFTLPGRGVRISPAHAWEKAIVLTPRPEVVRQQLIDALAETDGGRAEREVAAWLDRRVFFARQVRVRSRTVEFVVPASFVAADVAGARPDSDWSLTAFVTGAKLSIEADFKLLRSTPATIDALSLGVMQPAIGRPTDSFGYVDTRSPAPVVDVLASAPTQIEQLAGGTLTGMSWSSAGALLSSGNRTPTTQLALERRAAPAAPPALSPTALPPAPSASSPAVAAEPPVKPAAEKPVAEKPAAERPAAEKPAAIAPEPAAAPAPQPARPSVAERLKGLKQLFDQKLIDETEYKQQRQRILNEL